MFRNPSQKSSQIRALLVLVLLSLSCPWQRAKADFTPLGSASSVTQLREICDDIQSVVAIVQFYQDAFTVTAARDTQSVSGITYSLAQRADMIPKICSLVMAVLTAKNTEGILRAARLANRLTSAGLDTQIDFAEDSISMFDFLSRLTKVQDNRDLKQKLLNVNNHARIVNYMQRYNLFGDGTEGAIRESVAIDRQKKMEEITTQLFEGCRKIIGKPVDPSKLQTPDGEVPFFTAQGLLTKSVEAVEEQSLALKDIEKTQAAINKMLTKVIMEPDELESSSFILSKFVREGYWLSVGFIPPRNFSKSEPVVEFVPEPYAANRPPDSVSKKLPIREERDMKDVFYNDQGSFDGAQCLRKNKSKYQAEAWLVSNVNWLTDPFLKGLSISKAVDVCPTSPDEALDGLQVSMIAPEIKDSGLAQSLATQAAKDFSEHCQKTDQAELAKKLEKLKALGDDDPAFSGLRVQVDNCKPTFEDDVRLKPITYVNIESIKNMRDWMNHYSKQFSHWIETKYQLSLAENNVSSGVRNYVADPINKLFSGFYPNSRKSAWDPLAAQRLSPEQTRFYQDWRRFSFCTLPSTIKRRYPEKAELLKSMKNDSQEYLAIVKQCEFDESQPSANDTIFEDFMYGLIDSIERYHKARAVVLKTDLRVGAYKKGANLKNKRACDETLKPMDIATIQAKSNVFLFEEIADLHAFQRQVTLKRDQEDAKAKDSMAEVQRIWEMTNSMKATMDDQNRRFQYDPNSGDGADYDKMMPTLPENRMREKQFRTDHPEQ